MEDKIKSHCNQCGHVTNQGIMATHSDKGEETINEYFSVSWHDVWRIIKCLGCDYISTRVDKWFSEENEINTIYYPPVLSRKMPWWLEEKRYMIRDAALSDLFSELYIAHQNNAYFLSSMACRSIIDRIMHLSLGDEFGTFNDRLKKFSSNGYISDNETSLLKTVIEAGNASTHRGWSPKESQQLDTLIGIIENLTERIFVLEEMGKALKMQIPEKNKAKNDNESS